MSTLESARNLKASRTSVFKEIEAGRLHRQVGAHRWTSYENLIEYARRLRAKHEATLDRLTQNAHELVLNS